MNKGFSLKANVDNYIPVVLIALSLFGLACKVLLAFYSDLNSDTVVPGLLSMEIFRHGNVFLNGFNFPVNYPAVFTDLVPFYLLTQPLTDYSPAALSLMGFLIYVLILLVFSYIIFILSGNKIQALLFAALFSNLTPSAYHFFMQPVSHGATLLFSGIIFLTVLSLEKMRYYMQVILAIAVFLLVFSDNMSLAIIAIPLTCICIYKVLGSKKTGPYEIIRPALVILAPALLAYCLKLTMPSMAYMEITPVTAFNPLANIPGVLAQNTWLYVNGLFLAVNDSLFTLINGGTGVFELISAVIIILFIYAVLNILHNTKRDSNQTLFLLFLLVANVLLFLGYTLTTLNAPRYLMFTALSIFTILGLGYNGNKIYLALAMIIIIVGAYSCASAVLHINDQPNKEEYGLIDYLIQNNLSYGYGGYWDSNLLTYLSDEQVTVRAVMYQDNDMVPYLWLSSSGWYESRPDRFFVLYHQNHDDGNIGAIIYSNKPEQALQYGDYFIYEYSSNSSLRMRQSYG